MLTLLLYLLQLLLLGLNGFLSSLGLCLRCHSLRCQFLLNLQPASVAVLSSAAATNHASVLLVCCNVVVQDKLASATSQLTGAL